MTPRSWLLLLTVLACVPRGPAVLSGAQLQARASRTLAAPFDEVFDATWLSLELAGWTVTEHDARAGTLETNVLGGQAWSANVGQEGTKVVVTLLPRLLDAERAQWEGLLAGISALLDAWRVHPELVLSNTRGEVDAAGLRLLVPNWRHFEFSVDRRTLMMQGVAQAGFVPTLLYRVERRRPRADPRELVQKALDEAFHSTARTSEPTGAVENDAWGQSAIETSRVGADLTERAARWREWEARTPAWRVRVAAACVADDAACERDVRAVVESAVNTGAAVPGFKTR